MNMKRKKCSARKRLKMSDNDIEGLINGNNNVSDSGSIIIPRSNSNDLTEGNIIAKDVPVLSTASVECLSQTKLKHTYGLREHPIKKYHDDDQDEEDFSPDGSEYLPSPERKQRQNDLFGSCSTLGSEFVDDFSKDIPKTPSSVSNLSCHFAQEANFVASLSEIHIANSCPSTPKSFTYFSSSITPTNKKSTSTPKQLSNTCMDLVSYHDSHQRIFNSIDLPCLDITLKPIKNSTTCLGSDSYNREDDNKSPPAKSFACLNVASPSEIHITNSCPSTPKSLTNFLTSITPTNKKCTSTPKELPNTCTDLVIYQDIQQRILNSIDFPCLDTTLKPTENSTTCSLVRSDARNQDEYNKSPSTKSLICHNDNEESLSDTGKTLNPSPLLRKYDVIIEIEPMSEDNPWYPVNQVKSEEQEMNSNIEVNNNEDGIIIISENNSTTEIEMSKEDTITKRILEKESNKKKICEPETLEIDGNKMINGTKTYTKDIVVYTNNQSEKPLKYYDSLKAKKTGNNKSTEESLNDESHLEQNDEPVILNDEPHDKLNPEIVQSLTPNIDAEMQKTSRSESEYVNVIQISNEILNDPNISDENNIIDVETCEPNYTQEDEEIDTESGERNEILEENLNNPSTSTESRQLTRKRTRNEEGWQDMKAKRLKNSGECYTACRTKKKLTKKALGPVCSCRKRCGENISQNKRQAIFDSYYKLADHERQWDFILRNTKSESIKKIKLDRKNNRTQTVLYYFTVNNTKIQVCRAFFINTLSISNQTIYTALEKLQSDKEIKDNRGKHDNRPRKVTVDTEESVKEHISAFPTKESHYVRKDSKRSYLSEFLNISKMYRLYKEWFQEQNFVCDMASKRQYEIVFNTKFNLSFFKPKKDQCSTCTIFHEADAVHKIQLQESYDLHIKKKEQVRELKKEEKESFDKTTSTVAIFDLEKVLNIPQSPVGVFHYKRKYSVYNFTVYDSTNCQGYCYVWHQQIAKRGAIEIGSCLWQFVKNEHERGITEISFYSDGCAGQNKNRFIFAFYIYVVKMMQMTITHRFFTTGHGQSEGDSMHSTVERELKHKIVYTPEQIYSSIMNAKISGKKYEVKEMSQTDFYDIKTLISEKNWMKDENRNKIQWSKIVEVRASHSHPDCLHFKYNFDDEYSKLNTTTSTRIVRRKRNRNNSASVSTSNDDLKQAYQSLIPVSKALYIDLMSLCNTQAIPQHYHPFYKSLRFVDVIQEPQSESDSD